MADPIHLHDNRRVISVVEVFLVALIVVFGTIELCMRWGAAQ